MISGLPENWPTGCAFGYTPSGDICNANLIVNCQGVPGGSWGYACVQHPGIGPDCNYPAQLVSTQWIGYVTLGGTGENVRHWAYVEFPVGSAVVRTNTLTDLDCP